jgi:acetyl-CoA acetyltransferase
MGPPTLFTIPVLRYMKTYGLTHEQLAMVSVVQREWAAKNPRATFKTPITVEDVLNSRMIAYSFRLRHVRTAGERAPDARCRLRTNPGAKVSVCHGVGGMFAASGTIIMSNQALKATPPDSVQACFVGL